MTFEEAYVDNYALVLSNFTKFHTMEEAKEYTQDVFLLLHKDFSKFDNKYKMRSFIVNFIKMVKFDNARYNKHKNRNVIKISIDTQFDIIIQIEDPSNTFENVEKQYDFNKKLQRSGLSKRQRETFKFILNGKTNKEIQILAGYTMSNIKNDLAIIKERMSY